MESNKTEVLSFDEWLDTTKLRGYVDENSLEASWEAGQQSKQSEIDELQKRIDDALKELECIHFYKTQNSNNAIKILKGEYTK